MTADVPVILFPRIAAMLDAQHGGKPRARPPCFAAGGGVAWDSLVRPCCFTDVSCLTDGVSCSQNPPTYRQHSCNFTGKGESTPVCSTYGIRCVKLPVVERKSYLRVCVPLSIAL